MDPYDTKISDLLASSSFLQKHPGATQIGSDLYSSAVNSVSELIMRQRYTGQYVSNANQLSFGAQSSFFLTPGSIMNGLILSASVVLPQYTRANDNWLLSAIESIEMVVSGSSSIQSLKVSGRTHIDMIYASICSEKIRGIKAACPFIDLEENASGLTVNASVPLHLFFSSDELKAVFPLDTSTLQSQIIINVKWKPNYQIFSGDTTHAVVLPASFNGLYLRVGSQVQVNNDFALSNELKKDSNMIYSLPGTYLQSFTVVQNVSNLATENQITLTSMPSGQLQAILVSGECVATSGVVATTSLIQPHVKFDSIRILYNGIEIFRGDTENELRLFNTQMTDQGSGCNHELRAFPLATTGAIVAKFDLPNVTIIPFCNLVGDVLSSRRHEHTKDYSGNSLLFYYKLSPQIELFDATYPFETTLYSDPPQGYAQPLGDYRFTFSFVNAALYEVSQQTVALTM